MVVTNGEDCEWPERKLSMVFPVNNLRPSLGVLIVFSSVVQMAVQQRSLRLHTWVEKGLENWRSNAPPTPVFTDLKLRARPEEESWGQWPYQEAIGALTWVARMFRPGIVQDVTRYEKDRARKHLKSVKKILKFLSLTTNHGLISEKGKCLDLVAYSNSDCALETNRALYQEMYSCEQARAYPGSPGLSAV